MEVEQMVKYVVIIIVILAGLIILIYLLDQMMGGGFVRAIVCGALFWIPFGNLFTALTQMCAAIPA